jgi:two-component system sensor histidine kinase KdpD
VRLPRLSRYDPGSGCHTDVAPMKRLLLGYILAAVVSVLTLGLTLALRDWIAESPFPLFLAAVMVSTWVGGIGPGLLATLVGALAGSYFFLGSEHSFEISTATGAIRLLVYTLVAILISWLNGQLKVAHRRADVARAVAESTAEELRTLEHITDVSLRAATVDELLQSLLANVRDALAADAVRVLLFDESGDVLTVRASTELNEVRAVEHPIPLGRGIVGRAAQGDSVVVADQSDELDGRFDVWNDHIFSVAGVPLIIQRRTIGVLDIGAQARRRLAPRELRLLRLVAERVAIAIERAELLDAEKQAHAAARRAVTVRDEFLAHASHELRTPLSHIKGFVSTLRQTDIEWDEDTRADFLAEIERETDRLAKMVTDLLDMSRLESGGLEPGDRTRATPREIVNGGLNRVRGLLSDRRVECDIPSDLPNVLVDVAQTERVIANLLENAAKYAPADRPIHVKAGRVDSSVVICVDDEGPGIPEGAEDRIFEKFVRLPSTARGVPGTGLGLAISRHIANAHGGSLRSERGARGARFVLTLPLTPIKEAEDGQGTNPRR